MTRSNAERDEQLNQHEESIAKLQADVTDIGNKITSMMEMLAVLSAKDKMGSVSDLSSPKVEDPSSPHHRNEHGKQIYKEVSHPGEQPRRNYDGKALERNQGFPLMRIEFPHWEGGDPTDWVSRAECYFRFHRTPEYIKVKIASIHLDGEAIQWYDWFESSRGIPTWTELVDGLMARFGPAEYENVHGELAKIQQTSTVLEYQAKFERLANRARDWSEHQLVGTLVEGLKPDIHREDKMYRPPTMTAAISFARLQEERVVECNRSTIRSYPSKPGGYPPSKPAQVMGPSRGTPSKRLTDQEFKERTA